MQMCCFGWSMALVAWIGGTAPDYPPPMILAIEPSTATPGSSLTLYGRNMLPGVEVRVSEASTSDIRLSSDDSELATLIIAADATPGLYLVSLENSDGKRSNLMPLNVVAP